MSILIISSNPLFAEAVSATLTGLVQAEVRCARPEEAVRAIAGDCFSVLLVDIDIPAVSLKEVLALSQHQTQTRLILLSSAGNDLTVLDARPATITVLADLVDCIQESEQPRGMSQPALKRFQESETGARQEPTGGETRVEKATAERYSGKKLPRKSERTRR